MKLGDFVLYNGHHRRIAALHANVDRVDVAVLETDEDLLLNGGSEILELSPTSTAIGQHKKVVYSRMWANTRGVLIGEVAFFPEDRLREILPAL